MFDYLQTCKQCRGQVAYFITVHCLSLPLHIIWNIKEVSALHHHIITRPRPPWPCLPECPCASRRTVSSEWMNEQQWWWSWWYLFYSSSFGSKAAVRRIRCPISQITNKQSHNLFSSILPQSMILKRMIGMAKMIGIWHRQLWGNGKGIKH